MKFTSDSIRQKAEQLDLIVMPGGKKSKLTVEFHGRDGFDELIQVIGYRAAVQIGKNERRHGRRQK